MILITSSTHLPLSLYSPLLSSSISLLTTPPFLYLFTHHPSLPLLPYSPLLPSSISLLTTPSFLYLFTHHSSLPLSPYSPLIPFSISSHHSSLLLSPYSPLLPASISLLTIPPFLYVLTHNSSFLHFLIQLFLFIFLIAAITQFNKQWAKNNSILLTARMYICIRIFFILIYNFY